MTADPSRRRRASRIGIAALVGAGVVIVVLSVVAVFTLRSSEEGTRVEADDRPTQRFPSTPVGIVGVTAEDRLTSLVVLVLDPSGQGGSVVTVPVNIDTSSGFGAERTPLSRRAFSVDDPSALDDELATMLGISPSFSEIVDAAGLEALLGDLDGASVSLEEPIVDASDGVPETVVRSGDSRLSRAEVVDALTAVTPADEPSYGAHPGDIAVWSGVAETWSLTNDPLDLERDEVGTPIEPATFDELVARLRAGRVEVRDLGIDPSAAITLDNPDQSDFVIADSRDTVLVFASVAPDRMLTPHPTLTFSIVAPFSRSQLASFGEDATTSALVRDLIGELQFVEANVVSVDTRPAEDGAVAETVVILDEEEFEDEGTVPELIGPSTTRIAARDTDGSDIVLVLGTDFLDHRAELRSEEEEARSSDDGSADFEVPADEPADTDEGDDDAEEVVDDGAETDTVDGDE